MTVLKLEICEVKEFNDGPEWLTSLRTSWDTDAEPIQLQIKSPADARQEETLRWFLEGFIKDPFNEARADEARSYLQTYGAILCQTLCEAVSVPRSFSNASLLIIIKSGHAASRFQSLHWEILEDCALWVEPPSRITVLRQPFQTVRSLSPRITLREPLRVLIVCARDLDKWKRGKEINPRTITRPLLDIIEASGLKIDLHIVRPCTWNKFKEYLVTHSNIKFDIIHFDLHGEVVEDEGRQT